MGIETVRIPIQSSTVKPYIKQGDTIPKIVFTFDSGDDVNITGSAIAMKLFSNNRNEIFSITVGSGITIINNKEFEIDEVAKEDNDFPFGKLLGDLEITETNSKRTTYFNIEYTILEQFTK